MVASDNMDASVLEISALPEDNPVPFLFRRKFEGEHMLIVRVVLKTGCHVPVHEHVNEQIAFVVSGRVRWTLGHEAREVLVEGGSLVHLPPNCPHGVIALEDSLIIDILSPPGAMGVDSLPKA